ncbi:hypothetical protein BaRGS_00027275, partial [Batillaria attramentaria]
TNSRVVSNTEMALSVAFPLATMNGAEPMMAFDTSSTFPTLSCGAHLVSVKTEPGLFDETMEASYLNTTYTELSTANFLQLKQGQTELYPDSMRGESDTLASWTYRHPEHWGTGEVLDWLYCLADTEGFDGALFRGEAYQRLSGKQLCAMTLADFLTIDQNYGGFVHDVFKRLLDGTNFKKPSPPEMFKSDVLGNVPDFDFLNSAVDRTTPSRPISASSPSADTNLSVYMEHDQVKVTLDGYVYDIDIPNKAFDHIDDSDGYISGSEGDLDRSNSMSSEVFDHQLLPEDEESADLDVFCRKPQTPSVSSDSGCEEEEKRTTPRRRPASTSKGNHLWEFVRDLLKDPVFNPSLLKWEDKEEGVFKFVQSEAVAQMWGRKKNNPGMTYEKLSRAMRFCRSAGYFDSVPKTGRFPKKLCFKFGQKAHGWRD